MDTKRLISRAFAFAALMVLIVASFFEMMGRAHAQERDTQIVIGKEYQWYASICLTQKDAEAVLEAEVKDGHEAAGKVFTESPKCANLPVNFTVGKVVYLAGSGDKVYKVVEVTIGSETAYLLTSVEVVKYEMPKGKSV